MLVGQPRRNSSARSAVQEPYLNEKRLVHLLNSFGLFGERRRQRVQAHRAALIFLDDGQQQLAIHFVEAVLIYFQHLQCRLRRSQVYLPSAAHLGKIAHPPQQPVSDARRAPRAARNLLRAIALQRDVEDLGGALQDEAQLVLAVKIQPQQQAKARAQRGGEQSRARGGAHKGERLDVERVGTRRRPLPDDDVELVVFERRIKYLFQRRLQAVDFIEEH